MSNNIRTNLFTIYIWVATFTSAIFKGKIQPWTYSQLIIPTTEFYPSFKRYSRREVK